jgi:hypothetical protein
MERLDEQHAIDSEAIFRELEVAWLSSDAADPIIITHEQYQGFEEILTVVTCGFGMVANVMRTAAAAIDMTKLGYGHEVGPLVRLTFEHAMAIETLVTNGFAAVEAFGRSHASNLKRLQDVTAFGQPGVHEIESEWMDTFRLAAANTKAGPADNAIKMGTIGKSGDDTMAMLYFGWLRTTQTSHAGIITSRNYVRMSSDGTGLEWQRMFASDYDFPDCRTLLLAPVLEALWGYTKLGPTNLEQNLKPIMAKVDALTASYLDARAARSGAAS